MLERALIFALLLAVAALHMVGMRRGAGKLTTLAMSLFAAYALAWVLFMAYTWVNHINFPLNLEAMELTVLQHLRRVMAGQQLYVAPSPDFVPLAYGPLFYYLSVPFAWLLGANLFTMRLVAILGMLGSAIVMFLAVKRHTQSNWWGLMAVGLFAAAYRVMDTYLDMAHADSWLLFTVLLGCYLIEMNRSRLTNLLGIVVLCISFWFKQPGAIFAIGGALYLTWRDGWKSSWLYWLVAALLGPALYAIAPARILGPLFHYYTLTVPSHWNELNFSGLKRFVGYILKGYVALAAAAIAASIYLLIKDSRKVSLWYFMFPFGLLSGFGAFDPGSNNNVMIPMGAWFILAGTLGLHYLTEKVAPARTWAVHLAALAVSFALFFYSPASVLVPPNSPEAYRDLIGYLNSVNGPVYAPWLGQLEDGYVLSPAVHWVPMEDLIRGPGVNEYDHPTTRRLLDSVIHPGGTAYILTNYPLENDTLLSFLLKEYHLEVDLGERFSALSTLPRRYYLAYPRYLYRYGP